jgi:hypothetical protein
MQEEPVNPNDPPSGAIAKLTLPDKVQMFLKNAGALGRDGEPDRKKFGSSDEFDIAKRRWRWLTERNKFIRDALAHTERSAKEAEAIFERYPSAKLRFEAMQAEGNPEYITAKEMREELGLSAHYISSRLIRRLDFPAPVISLSQKTRFWLRVDWENWKRRRGGIPKGA